MSIDSICTSLDDVRKNIDRIDKSIIALIAERGLYVKQAALFKKNEDEVKAPARVEQVINKVVSLAKELGASSQVIESTYRAMIDSFIALELQEHRVQK
jgi:isochorismate pyruvate lyase